MRCNVTDPTTAHKVCQLDAGHGGQYHRHEVEGEQCGRPMTNVTIWPKVGWQPKQRRK